MIINSCELVLGKLQIIIKNGEELGGEDYLV